MKILVINGPNLNMLGIREPGIYGDQSFAALCDFIKAAVAEVGATCELYQSNHEGCLVDKIQEAYGKFDGIVINPGAYTHTSVAILDALSAVHIPTVEVHISNVMEREAFRHHSFVSLVAKKTYMGLGFEGYRKAVRYLALGEE
ncbi:MAG: type II 3-dehydroquinate dehydratase [Ruminococcaceae bacterium]|nr:type II 3-dehydroquinate dehydratase [Oscillospiraceae bacterium]